MSDRIISEALYQQVVEALEDVDGLIVHQFSGTREGMSALQNACDDALAALTALSTAMQAQPIDRSADALDAERYRWLRDPSNWTEDGICPIVASGEDTIYGEHLDKSIDAVMQAQQPKEST